MSSHNYDTHSVISNSSTISSKNCKQKTGGGSNNESDNQTMTNSGMSFEAAYLSKGHNNHSSHTGHGNHNSFESNSNGNTPGVVVVGAGNSDRSGGMPMTKQHRRLPQLPNDSNIMYEGGCFLTGLLKMTFKELTEDFALTMKTKTGEKKKKKKIGFQKFSKNSEEAFALSESSCLMNFVSLLAGLRVIIFP